MDSSSLRSPSLANVRRQAIERLRKVYSLEEAQAITRTLLKHFLPDWEMDWLTSRGQAPFPPHRLAQWESALSAAAQGYPVAYILGYTTFLGYRITVQPGVFIPRPETEEWIAWTIQYLADRPPQRILEIGSGSGALLVALGKALPQAALFALDKNPLAIHLTQKNCHTYGLQVLAELHDLLQNPPLPPSWEGYQWDLIISNPPYIPHADKENVAPNVLAHEPYEALFCEDVEFYQRIGQIALESLSPGGVLVAELYPPTAQKVEEIYRGFGMEVTLYRDLSGRWRWIVASLSEKVRTFGTVSGSSSAR